MKSFLQHLQTNPVSLAFSILLAEEGFIFTNQLPLSILLARKNIASQEMKGSDKRNNGSSENI